MKEREDNCRLSARRLSKLLASSLPILPSLSIEMAGSENNEEGKRNNVVRWRNRMGWSESDGTGPGMRVAELIKEQKDRIWS